jgi:hypothetical protein
MNMKQFKLFSLVALVLSLSVSSAFADTGKVGSDEVGGKMCEKLVASLIKKQEVAKAEVAPAAPAHEEPSSSTTNAM